MGAVIWVVAIAAFAVALFAVRRSAKLARDLDRLRREQYDTESRVKRIPEEVRELVDPLRLHLATVAAGGQVPRDMILNGWLYHDVAAEEAERMLADAGREPDRVVWVDVRTPREYAARHVPGAKLVPFEELETRYETEIPRTADKVFVYCMGGERSRYACEFLGRRGYANLYNLKDGLQGWRGPTEGESLPPLIQIESRRKAASTATA
ncbi:rhodanese-like domain-containing protein [Nitrospira sp. Kam-Ns4a]